MAKYGFDERRLFNISEEALENLSVTPSDAEVGQFLVYIKSDHLYIKKPSISEVLMPEDGTNLGVGSSIFKQKNSSAQLEFRKLKNLDGYIDITENADDITFAFDTADINNDLDHGVLLGLADDDHLQYLLLAGRAGGQIANGGTASGDDLELRSTTNATKGSVQIIDGSEFRHSDNHKSQTIVQTTDATVTTLATTPLTDNRVYNFKVTVVARRSDGGGQARGSWSLQTTAYRAAAGAATLQGSVKQDYKSSSAAPADADISVSGNDVLVRVTGIAAQTFEWKAYIEYTESN